MRLVVIHGHRDPGHVGISAECVQRVRRAEQVADVDVVMFSGAGAPESPSEAAQMSAMWCGDPVHLHLDEQSRDTIENVFQAALLAGLIGATEVVLVSSFWHLPRVALHWRGRKPQVRLVPAWGSWRYIPDELRALADLIARR